MKKYILGLGIAILGLALSVQAQTFVFSNNLSVGASGNDVVALQTWLISNSYDIPAISLGTVVKGYFGSQTRAALIRYQVAAGLPGTGYFGPLTRGKLNAGGSIASLNLLSPNGNEVWAKGTTQTISWNGTPGILNQSGILRLQTPVPSCAQPSSPVQCMMATRAPYEIAKVSLSSRYYTWRVGDQIGNVSEVIPEGNYKIEICNSDSSVCDVSDREFTITKAVDTARTPVINSIIAPTMLNPGQVGTWQVMATDPQSSTLQYTVDWGDVVYATAQCPAGYTCEPTTMIPLYRPPPPLQQGSTFTNSYSRAGVYTITFTVRNSAGLSAVSTVTVNVSGQSSGVPTVISPNGGEVFVANTVQTIRWDTNSNGQSIPLSTKLDIYLDPIYSQGCLPNGACSIPPPPPPPLSIPRPATLLDKNISVSTVYNWIVGTDINNANIPAGDYKVRICLAGATENCDSSNSLFTISRN